ncbi:MAG: phosphoribosylaminoimidazolesuccinocarboxamide synthase [Leucobacter sp.]|jgi:phosphoribosylaminoimidazole-succinocarboxamide synthase
MVNLGRAPELAGWQHIYSGKVRDLYIPEGAASLVESPALLVVASDRLSAFDHVLEPPITGKGALLTALSRWWFERLDVPNHLADANGGAGGAVQDPATPPVPAEIADRAMLTRRLEMHPIECVVRGALTGSGFAEYRETGAVCGIELPAGLEDGDLLETPIYTPAFKAPLGEHDENITYERSVELVGEEVAAALRDTSLRIFTAARELAAERGVVLADTKFEFGWDPHGSSSPAELVLADEVLTSDSSRYWDAETYRAGGPGRLASFDKQIVRDWLAANWDRMGEPPELPDKIVLRTLDRYAELYARLTGE